MRLHFFIWFLLIITAASNAQPPVDWMRVYNTGREDVFRDIYAVANDGYVLCGNAYDRDNPALSCDMWIARIGEDGGLIWSEIYRLINSYDILYSIIETDQGEFLSGGAFDNSFAAILVDDEGEQIWLRAYADVVGGCHAVIELKRGEFVLAGSSDYQGFLICINRIGQVLWEESCNVQMIRSIRETDGGIIAAGYSRFPGQNPILRISVLKVDFEGNLLWLRQIAPQDEQTAYAMVSVPEGGFALAGRFRGNQGPRDNDFGLVKINDRGNFEWFRRYDVLGNHDFDHCTCLTRINIGDFILVGYNSPQRPLSVRVRPDGSQRWHEEYEFDEDDGFAMYEHAFLSVVEADDHAAIACGFTTFLENDEGKNGLIMKLEPEIMEPQFISWTPEDTMLTVLLDDTVDFLVEVSDAQDDEISYLWIMGEDTISRNATTTVVFEELGEYEIQCQVSDGEFTVAITWHVTVIEWFIQTFTPDSLDLIIRRSSNIDFSLDIAALEDIELNYLWTLTDRNRRREEVGEADSVIVRFDLAGDFQLEGFVWRGEESDAVVWDVLVRSAVWYWWPREDSLVVPVDTTVLFAITPFNPDSDSLEYLWTLDGDSIDFEREIEILFEEMGLREVVAYVHDGCEVDTIRWDVTVIPFVSAPESDIGLLPTKPVLYPPAPNPFNSSVNLSFYLPRDMNVTLSIYNLAGREIVQLLNEHMTAGKYNCTWNAVNKPNGIYPAVLKTGTTESIVKTILVK